MMLATCLQKPRDDMISLWLDARGGDHGAPVAAAESVGAASVVVPENAVVASPLPPAATALNFRLL